MSNEGYSGTADTSLPALQPCPTALSAERAPQDKNAASLLMSRILSATLSCDSQSIKCSITNTGGNGFSWSFALDDKVANLVDVLKLKCGWVSMQILTENGSIVQLNEELRDLGLVVAKNIEEERRFEAWKQRYQLVGKVLVAMKDEVFLPKSEKFNLTWKGNTAAEVDMQTFDELIGDALGDEGRGHIVPSCQFVQVAGYLLERNEAWNLMNLQLLQTFDPGMKSFKHQLTIQMLEAARQAASSPIVLASLPFAVAYKSNKTGMIIGCSLSSADPSYQPLDRHLQISLNLADLGVMRDWDQPLLCGKWTLDGNEEFTLERNDSRVYGGRASLSCDGSLRFKDGRIARRPIADFGEVAGTWREVARLLKDMDGDYLSDDSSSALDLPIEMLPSNDAVVLLFSIQMRLSSGVCPVLIQGNLNSEIIKFLARVQGHELTTLRSSEDLQLFCSRELEITRSRVRDAGKTIYGRVYVERGKESGCGSFHFASEDDCYISYECAPDSYKLDDGSPYPQKMKFCRHSFDPETREFKGEIEWGTSVNHGQVRWEYKLIFSENRNSIVSGEKIRYGADGSRRGDTTPLGKYVGQVSWHYEIGGRLILVPHCTLGTVHSLGTVCRRLVDEVMPEELRFILVTE